MLLSFSLFIKLSELKLFGLESYLETLLLTDFQNAQEILFQFVHPLASNPLGATGFWKPCTAFEERISPISSFILSVIIIIGFHFYLSHHKYFVFQRRDMVIGRRPGVYVTDGGSGRTWDFYAETRQCELFDYSRTSSLLTS